FLNGAKMFTTSGKWHVFQFHSFLIDSKATLTALVPTQVHDLVANKLRSPKTLRAVIVGGGSLNSELYDEARALGWPVMPSYGMTECASQIATANLKSPSLNILPHLTIKIVENKICIKGESL